MSELFVENSTFTVAEITSLIRNTLENEFDNVTIEGEISNFKPSSLGHWYFTLKDEEASIAAVLFKGKSRYVPFTPQDGMRVIASGHISVYAARGSYQIVVDSLKQSGTGDIFKILEERKQRLLEEGLFDEKNKVALPLFPRTIGVVTSPTGAALRDIINVTKRRNDGVCITVLPCVVQGADASASIAKQIKIANEHNLCDVLIVGRGGGSLEDLLPFSEEIVVRAVAESKIPIVSAVGHEIDFALSDFAADVRAPTPSAGAELVTPLKSDIQFDIAQNAQTLEDEMNLKLRHCRLLMQSFSVDALEAKLKQIEAEQMQRLQSAQLALETSIKEKLFIWTTRVKSLQEQIISANPKNILARGFAIVKNAKTGTLVKSAQDVKTNDALVIQVDDGTISATVQKN